MNSYLKVYKNKKIMVTGSTGFKGSWLCFWLYNLNSKVIGIGLKPEKGSILFKKLNLKNKIKQYYVNIIDYKNLNKIIKKEKPDLIIHMAAQSIVSLSYSNPSLTLNTNINGSLNILRTARENKIKNLIFITSDKCYLNKDDKKAYKEDDILGGEDFYSASKASAELIFFAFIKSFKINKNNIKFASVRAGNVIGGGDMKINRILPDIVKSIINKSKLNLRNPKSTRPWQHVLEPLYGYLILGNYLIKKKIKKKIKPNWNFGPELKNIKTVLEVTKESVKNWKIKKKIFVNKNKSFKESQFLFLNSSKAKKELKWKPKLNFNETIKLTIDWYKAMSNNEDLEHLTLNQINFFIDK